MSNFIIIQKPTPNFINVAEKYIAPAKKKLKDSISLFDKILKKYDVIYSQNSEHQKLEKTNYSYRYLLKV